MVRILVSFVSKTMVLISVSPLQLLSFDLVSSILRVLISFSTSVRENLCLLHQQLLQLPLIRGRSWYALFLCSHQSSSRYSINMNLQFGQNSCFDFCKVMWTNEY